MMMMTKTKRKTTLPDYTPRMQDAAKQTKLKPKFEKVLE